MEQEVQPAPPPGGLPDPSAAYRLDYNGASRRNPTRAAYGFVISTADGGHLVAVGNGVLPAGNTLNQAECHGLIEGLKVAQSLGLKRLKAYGNSELVVQQVQHRSKVKSTKLRPLLTEALQLVDNFDVFQIANMDRAEDSVAHGLAKLAMNEDSLLLEAGTAQPSHYSRVARRLGAALLLRREAIANLDGADNFIQAVVQAVALRLHLDPAAVAARMDALVACKQHDQPCYTEGLRILRTFTPAEAAAMATALAAMQKSETLGPVAAAAQLLIGDPGSAVKQLPAKQARRQQQQQQQQAETHGADDDGGQQGFVASALQGIEGIEALEGLLLGDAMLSETMAVQDGRVTHLLMFDGASKGNPGRAAFGYAIFDLYSKKLDAKGCRTLPYGRTAHEAEYHGLLAGLEAAAAMGIQRILVQGDAALVVEQVMYRRCTGGSSTARLFNRVLSTATQFEHFEIQLVPREMNRVADRLAQISIDIDGVLYALLRKDVRGEGAMAMLLKAARLFKRNDRVSRLMRQQDFPVLLVALLQTLMTLPPAELLQRLEDKAAAMGDPNPWLVQEVRRVVNESPLVFRSGSAASAALLQDGRTKAARQNYRLAVGDEDYWRSSAWLRHSGKSGSTGSDDTTASSSSSSSSSSNGSSAGGDDTTAPSNGSSSSSSGSEIVSSSVASSSGFRLPRTPVGAAHYSSVTHSSSNSWHSRIGPPNWHDRWPLLATRQQECSGASLAPNSFNISHTGLSNEPSSSVRQVSTWQPQPQQQQQQQQQQAQQQQGTSHHRGAGSGSIRQPAAAVTCCARMQLSGACMPMLCVLAAASAVTSSRLQPAVHASCLGRFIVARMQRLA